MDPPKLILTNAMLFTAVYATFCPEHQLYPEFVKINFMEQNNIRNYKKYSAMQLCSLIQKDNNIKCKPYNCTECHLEMLKRLKNNTVFLQNR